MPMSNQRPDAPPGEGDRRRSKRRLLRRLLPWRVTVVGSGTDFQASVIDLSLMGVGLMASRRLEPGTAVLLRHTAGAPMDGPIAARVVYECELAPGRFVFGAEFEQPLTAEQLHSLAAMGRRRYSTPG